MFDDVSYTLLLIYTLFITLILSDSHVIPAHLQMCICVVKLASCETW